MRLREVCGALCVTLIPLAPGAQGTPLRAEVGGSVALGHLFRLTTRRSATS